MCYAMGLTIKGHVSKGYMFFFLGVLTDNPAVSAVRELVEVIQGSHAVLEVYVSGYPLVTGDHINWYWPNGSEILEHEGDFMSDRRALFLVNVQSSVAGTYRCEVTIPGTRQSSSTLIRVNVYGKLMMWLEGGSLVDQTTPIPQR